MNEKNMNIIEFVKIKWEVIKHINSTITNHYQTKILGSNYFGGTVHSAQLDVGQHDFQLTR